MKKVEVELVQQEQSDSNVPIWYKLCLTVKEASAYSGIGEKKIRELMDEKKCPFVISKGGHRMIKRKQFEVFIDKCNTL